MPDNTDKINIVAPDGRVFEGTRDQLKKLQVLGDYTEQSTRDLRFQEGARQTKEDYTQPLQQAKTVGEGILSGATIGGSDLLINSDESDLRAANNPGKRLAGELIGGIGTAFIPGAPANLISRGAATLGKTVGGGLKGAAIAGGVEGAAAGLQADISNATLTNDPITASSLTAGIGYGTLFGAGLNTAIHGIGKGATRLGNKLETKPSEPIYKPVADDLGEVDIVTKENYDAFRQNIKDTRETRGVVDKYISDIDESIATIKAEDAATLKAMDDGINARLEQAKELKGRIPTAKKEHAGELKLAEAEVATAQKALDTFNKDVEEALELSAKQYKEEALSGGLRNSANELKASYEQMFQKLAPINNELASDISVTLKKSLKEYDNLLKKGDYKAAHDVLKRTQSLMSNAEKKFKTGVTVPEIKTTIKANPGALAEQFEKTTAFEEAVGAATKKFDDLKARGPRDYSREVSEMENEIADLMEMRNSFKPSDLTHALANREGHVQLGKALDDLRNFPNTAQEFRAMGTAKVNRLSDSLDMIMKASKQMPELAPVVASLEKASQSLVESTGIRAEGGIIEQLKAIQKVSKEANKAAVLGPIEHEIVNSPTRRGNVSGASAGLVKDYGASVAASTISRVSGLGGGLSYFGIKHALLNGVEGLAGIKSSVQNRISRAAKSIGKTFQSNNKNYVVPKLEPLYTKLNGDRDKEAKNPREAARNRINEMMDVAPVITDVMYKALEPFSGTIHSEVIAGMHAAAVEGWNALMELLPKDRIGTTVAFNNTWEPNDVETVIASKLFQVFYAPVEVIENATKGTFDAIQITALKKIWPHLYQQFQTDMIDTLADNPQLMKTYNNQSALSTLCGIKVSSAFKPENIVDAAAIFIANPEPNPLANMNAEGGSKNNSGGGRPSKVNTGEPPTTGQSLLGVA